MQDPRTKGLLRLQAICTLIFILAAFIIEFYGVNEYMGNLYFVWINCPLYLMGIFVAGVIFFNFYNNPRIAHAPFTLQNALRLAFRQTVCLAFILMGIVFATKDKAISRIFLGGYVVSMAIFLVVLNYVLPRLLSRFFFGGMHRKRSILVGSMRSALHLESWWQDQSLFGQEVVGLVLADASSMPIRSTLSIPILGSSDILPIIIRDHAITEVVLLETHHDPHWVDLIERTAQQEGCRFLLYNPWQEFFTQPLVVIQSGLYAFFALAQEPLSNPFNRLLKRTLDVVVSLPIVLLIFPILTIIVALMQRKQSPGPILYRQKRTGLNQQVFMVLKYRTLAPDPLGSRAPIEVTHSQDPRVYAFGHFLRKTSLDEFPQFLHVLSGRMSLVGPRPHWIGHDKLFSRAVGHYRQRHLVKPGITGLAQVSGFRGEITDPKLLKRRIDLDLQYMNTWTLGLDVEILLKTVIQIFRPPPSAY